MVAQFNVSKQGEFGIKVQGLETYLDPDGPSVDGIRRYKWKHSVTINVLYYIEANENVSFLEHQIIEHKTDLANDIGTFMVQSDGHHTISHIILPTKDWVLAMREEDSFPELEKTFKDYKDVIYYDDGTICKMSFGETATESITLDELMDTQPEEVATVEVITLDELMDIQPEAAVTVDEITSLANTVVRAPDKGVFYTPHLERCFSGLIKNLLQDVYANMQCPNPTLIAKQRDRDIIWMFVNGIEYAKKYMNFYEAQRLLERLNRCNVICGKNKLLNKTRHCGC